MIISTCMLAAPAVTPEKVTTLVRVKWDDTLLVVPTFGNNYFRWAWNADRREGDTLTDLLRAERVALKFRYSFRPLPAFYQRKRRRRLKLNPHGASRFKRGHPSARTRSILERLRTAYMRRRYPISDQFSGPIWRGDTKSAVYFRFYNNADLMMFRLLCPVPIDVV